MAPDSLHDQEYPGNAAVFEAAADELVPDVREAVEALYADGTVYVKSAAVCEAVGLEATKVNHQDVGRALRQLSEGDDEIVEEWGSGKTQTTWRILPPEERGADG